MHKKHKKHRFATCEEAQAYKAFLERVSAPAYPIKITPEELEQLRAERAKRQIVLDGTNEEAFERLNGIIKDLEEEKRAGAEAAQNEQQ